MGNLRKFNWHSLLAMLLVLYYFLNATGLFVFFMKLEKLKYLQSLYMSNTVLFWWFLVSTTIVFPFLFFSYWLGLSVRKYMQYYFIFMMSICIYGIFRIDFMFFILLALYAAFFGSLKIVSEESKNAKQK